jgi:hypothetical protein
LLAQCKALGVVKRDNKRYTCERLRQFLHDHAEASAGEDPPQQHATQSQPPQQQACLPPQTPPETRVQSTPAQQVAPQPQQQQATLPQQPPPAAAPQQAEPASIDVDDIRQAIGLHSSALGAAATLATLQRFGAGKATEVAPEHRAACHQALMREATEVHDAG